MNAGNNEKVNRLELSNDDCMKNLATENKYKKL